MRTISTEIYKFDELPVDAQKKAIRAEVEFLFQTFDHTYITNEWTKLLESLGFHNITFYYTGFGSQGDGAMFTADWDSGRFDKAAVEKCDFVSNKELLKFLTEHFEMFSEIQDRITAEIVHRGPYSHYNSKRIDFNHDCVDSEVSQSQINTVEYDFDVCYIQICKEVYKQLEIAYYEHVSEESAINSIRANEYEYTIDGKPYLSL